MADHHGDHRRKRRRLWLLTGLIGAGAAIVAIALSTGILRRGDEATPALSAEQLAQQHCQADVMKRLASPDRATISDVRADTASLDSDGRDFSSLNASEPLKGIDRTRITVLNVSGVANTASEVGSTIKDHFDCRAYFVDGALTHTLVVFDHAH